MKRRILESLTSRDIDIENAEFSYIYNLIVYKYSLDLEIDKHSIFSTMVIFILRFVERVLVKSMNLIYLLEVMSRFRD